MFKKYPRIGDVTKLRQPCKKLCSICKSLAVAIVCIQNSCFRGDDDLEARCEEHIKATKPKNTAVSATTVKPEEKGKADEQ